MKVELEMSFEDLIWLHNVVERMSAGRTYGDSVIAQIVEHLKKGDKCDT